MKLQSYIFIIFVNICLPVCLASNTEDGRLQGNVFIHGHRVLVPPPPPPLTKNHYPPPDLNLGPPPLENFGKPEIFFEVYIVF
jgi:hypothetical protein